MFRRPLRWLCAMLAFLLTAAAAPSIAEAPTVHVQVAAVMLLPGFLNSAILSLLGKLTPLVVSALVAPVMHLLHTLSSFYQETVPLWLKPILGATLGLVAAQLLGLIGLQLPAGSVDQWSVNTVAGLLGGLIGYVMHWIHVASSAPQKA